MLFVKDYCAERGIQAEIPALNEGEDMINKEVVSLRDEDEAERIKKEILGMSLSQLLILLYHLIELRIVGKEPEKLTIKYRYAGYEKIILENISRFNSPVSVVPLLYMTALYQDTEISKLSSAILNRLDKTSIIPYLLQGFEARPEKQKMFAMAIARAKLFPHLFKPLGIEETRAITRRLKSEFNFKPEVEAVIEETLSLGLSDEEEMKKAFKNKGRISGDLTVEQVSVALGQEEGLVRVWLSVGAITRDKILAYMKELGLEKEREEYARLDYLRIVEDGVFKVYVSKDNYFGVPFCGYAFGHNNVLLLLQKARERLKIEEELLYIKVDAFTHSDTSMDFLEHGAITEDNFTIPARIAGFIGEDMYDLQTESPINGLVVTPQDETLTIDETRKLLVHTRNFTDFMENPFNVIPKDKIKGRKIVIDFDWDAFSLGSVYSEVNINRFLESLKRLKEYIIPEIEKAGGKVLIVTGEFSLDYTDYRQAWQMYEIVSEYFSKSIPVSMHSQVNTEHAAPSWINVIIIGVVLTAAALLSTGCVPMVGMQQPTPTPTPDPVTALINSTGDTIGALLWLGFAVFLAVALIIQELVRLLLRALTAIFGFIWISIGRIWSLKNQFVQKWSLFVFLPQVFIIKKAFFNSKIPGLLVHSKSVARMCKLIAVELGFKGHILGLIYLAGLLHDIGKQLQEEVFATDRMFSSVERAMLTDDHARLSRELIEKLFGSFRIPKWLLYAIEYHHDPWAIKGIASLKEEGKNLAIRVAQIIFISDEIDARNDASRPHKDFVQIEDGELFNRVKRLAEYWKYCGILDQDICEATRGLVDKNKEFRGLILAARRREKMGILASGRVNEPMGISAEYLIPEESDIQGLLKRNLKTIYRYLLNIRRIERGLQGKLSHKTLDREMEHLEKMIKKAEVLAALTKELIEKAKYQEANSQITILFDGINRILRGLKSKDKLKGLRELIAI